MMMLTDPFAGRKLEEEGAVKAAVGAEVDVLDNGRLAQPGLTQAAGEPLVLAAGRLAIDEQPEPVFATEFAPASGAFCSSRKASAIAVRPSARKRSTVG